MHRQHHPDTATGHASTAWPRTSGDTAIDNWTPSAVDLLGATADAITASPDLPPLPTLDWVHQQLYTTAADLQVGDERHHLVADALLILHRRMATDLNLHPFPGQLRTKLAALLEGYTVHRLLYALRDASEDV